MAFSPLKGKFAKLAKSGSPDVIFAGINWTLPIDGVPQDASNFRDGRRVMTTLDDAEITVGIIWDTDKPPTEAANEGLRIDADFDAKFFVDNNASPAAHFAAPVKVVRLELANEGTASRVMFNATLRLNGEITYPTYGGGG